MFFENKEIIISGGLITVASLAPECYEAMTDPEAFIQQLKITGINADIFSFRQRLPEIEPKYNYYMEWESIAACRIKSYEDWLNNQVEKGTRKNVNKALKKGVITKLVHFDDNLIRGIMNIYDETPIRQNKPFPHYKKDFETIKKEHATYLDKCDFIGAYYNEELIGFIKMYYSEKCASTLQVISKIEHRDKKTNNALLAKAVEICDQKKMEFLQYGVWSFRSFGDFKKSNGFERIDLPRYYVPLNAKGCIALKLKLHHGLKNMLPKKIVDRLLDLRVKWYGSSLSLRMGCKRNSGPSGRN